MKQSVGEGTTSAPVGLVENHAPTGPGEVPVEGGSIKDNMDGSGELGDAEVRLAHARLASRLVRVCAPACDEYTHSPRLRGPSYNHSPPPNSFPSDRS